MKRLRRQGVSDSQIAKFFNISRERVGQILGRKSVNGRVNAS
jgi:DNA-binding CsgD family transcriptional regulator